MHVVMFADQHLESLGGAQVSMRLQKRFLERAGHVVTVVAPHLHRPASDDPAYLDLPSIAITPDREYALTWPGARTDRFLDAEMGARLPVDVVHVQADFWGAFIGHRYAARHGLPVVHTMHNRVDVGIEATAPFPAWCSARSTRGPAAHCPPRDRGPGLSHRPAVIPVPRRRAVRTGLIRAMPRAHRRPLRRRASTGGPSCIVWPVSRAVTAPSGHFARRLEQHGVAASVDVIWNGIDDDVLDAALAFGPSARRPAVRASSGSGA